MRVIFHRYGPLSFYARLTPARKDGKHCRSCAKGSKTLVAGLKEKGVDATDSAPGVPRSVGNEAQWLFEEFEARIETAGYPLLVYVGGHGTVATPTWDITDSGGSATSNVRSDVALHHGRFRHEGRLYQGLATHELIALLTRSREPVLLVLDSCQSGAGSQQAVETVQYIGALAARVKGRTTTLTVLAACGAHENAYDGVLINAILWRLRNGPKYVGRWGPIILLVSRISSRTSVETRTFQLNSNR